MTTSWRIDPDLTEEVTRRPRACNDGGGRNGNPTLLEAIATLMGREPWLRIDEKALESLGAIVGHKSTSVTRTELREMSDESMTIFLIHSGPEFIVWITDEGHALMATYR
jgi:hypothetical protein